MGTGCATEWFTGGKKNPEYSTINAYLVSLEWEYRVKRGHHRRSAKLFARVGGWNKGAGEERLGREGLWNSLEMCGSR